MKQSATSNSPHHWSHTFTLLVLGSLIWTNAALQPVRAETFTVNSTIDATDATPGDGTCASSTGACTLRAAIEESNALPGFPPDVINLPAGTYVLTMGRLEISSSLSIIGDGADVTIIDGNSDSQIIFITNPGTDPIVNISGVTIRNGDGGIAFGTGVSISEGSSLSLSNSVVSENTSQVGGVGILNSGFLTLIRSTVRDNLILGGGGGITGTGAGLFNSGDAVANIVESTISNNRGIRGGGISNNARLNITNSTISGNVASAGGGIRNTSGGVVNISFSTITDNEAGFESGEPVHQRLGGGIFNIGGGQVNIGNSILAGNTDGRVLSDPLYAPDCFSNVAFRFTSFRGNIVGVINGNCDFRDTIFGAPPPFDAVGSPASPLDPLLATLAYNGGPTLTHALLAGSPAIDEGTGVTSATFFDCPDTDQRSLVRPVDGDVDSSADCDVGAFEFGAMPQDETQPSCEMVSVDMGPPTTLSVRVQDAESGIAAIDVIQNTNATVAVPVFSAGTTDPLMVVATKINQGEAAVVELEVRDVAGNAIRCDPVVTTVSAEVPENFELAQNYPNPFNPTTTVRFQLPEQARVVLEIYDALGRRVRTLIDEQMDPGTYSADWNGTDDSGLVVAGGAYIYHLRAGTFTESKVMILAK